MSRTSYVSTADAGGDRVERLPGDGAALYRALLLVRRVEQMARLAELTTSADAPDVDDHTEIAEMVVREELNEIDSALARLEAATYGTCETCQEEISHARLDAIPHVRTCLACAR
jgi:RNA polymerase-binding transcription factor DksA